MIDKPKITATVLCRLLVVIGVPAIPFLIGGNTPMFISISLWDALSPKEPIFVFGFYLHTSQYLGGDRTYLEITKTGTAILLLAVSLGANIGLMLFERAYGKRKLRGFPVMIGKGESLEKGPG